MHGISAGLVVALLVGACGESPPKFDAPMTLLSITPHGGSQAITPHGGSQAITPHGGSQAITPDGGSQAITPQWRSRGETVSADVLNSGERVYAMRCTICHADDGSGKGPGASGLREQPRDFREADFRYKSTPEGELPSDEDLLATIRNGRIESGMPAFPGLTDADITAVVHYLKTFSPRWQEPPKAATP